jgi:hypothetical protein
MLNGPPSATVQLKVEYVPFMAVAPLRVAVALNGHAAGTADDNVSVTEVPEMMPVSSQLLLLAGSE